MRIVVLVGLPGCGKSTYLARKNAVGLSSDAIRLWLTDDESDQTIHGRVFETLRYLLRQRLTLGRAVTYVDATNLTPQERAPYVGMGASYGCEVEAVFFAVPLEICRQRNAGRRRVVPDEAMDKLAAKLVPPDVSEGFSRVSIISTADVD